MIPKDPIILLSYINAQLRDYYPTIEDLCKSLDLEQSFLTNKLAAIGYAYNKKTNQFI